MADEGSENILAPGGGGFDVIFGIAAAGPRRIRGWRSAAERISGSRENRVIRITMEAKRCFNAEFTLLFSPALRCGALSQD